MQDDFEREGRTLEQWLFKDLPSQGLPAWEPPDDPFPPVLSLLLSDSSCDNVMNWYSRNWRRAIDELCDPVGNIVRVKSETFASNQKYSAVKQWLVPRLSSLWVEMTEIHDRFPLFSKEWVEALREHGKKWAALRVPERLTGRVKARMIPDAELPKLLHQFEKVKTKARVARGKVLKSRLLWQAFPELPPDLCEPGLHFDTAKFAKRAIAAEYECEVSTIEKALTRARNSALLTKWNCFLPPWGEWLFPRRGSLGRRGSRVVRLRKPR
jgi:hypothetical protein